MHIAYVLLRYLILAAVGLAALWIVASTVLLVTNSQPLPPVRTDVIIPLFSSSITLALGYLFGSKD
jgi:hypothetical protein